MKRRVVYHIILFPLLLGACGDRPTSTVSTGRIVLEVRYGQESATKPVEVQVVDRMVATITQSGTVVVQQDLRRNGGRWQAEIEVDAGSYKVELAAYKFSKVTWRGITLVGVRAGKMTTAPLLMYLMNAVVEARFGFNSGDEIAGWSKTGGSGSWQVMNGRLLLTGESTEYFMEIGPTNTFSGDIKISVETEWMDGTDDSLYGVVFHLTEDGGYGFGIAGDGHYGFWEWASSGPAVPLIDWTYSSVIDKKGRNTLRIVTNGPQIVLYINGTRVDSVVDPTHAQGLVGLNVSSSQQVAFDNLDITGTIAGKPIGRKRGIYQAEKGPRERLGDRGRKVLVQY